MLPKLYHPELIIETLLGPPIKGADAARRAVASVFPAVKEIRIIRHIAEGDWCATLLDFEYVFGTFRIIDVFHVVDGRIVSIQAYYDPRPILQGLQQFMSSR